MTTVHRAFWTCGWNAVNRHVTSFWLQVNGTRRGLMVTSCSWNLVYNAVFLCPHAIKGVVLELKRETRHPFLRCCPLAAPVKWRADRRSESEASLWRYLQSYRQTGDFSSFYFCCVIAAQHEALSTTYRTPESLRRPRPRPVWRQKAVWALHPSITAASVWLSALISSNAGRWMSSDRRTALTKRVISSSANLIQGDDYAPPATETSVSRDELWKQMSLGRSQQILG